MSRIAASRAAKLDGYPLGKLSDDDLFKAGVPKPLIAAVKAIHSDEKLNSPERLPAPGLPGCPVWHHGRFDARPGTGRDARPDARCCGGSGTG